MSITWDTRKSLIIKVGEGGARRDNMNSWISFLFEDHIVFVVTDVDLMWVIRVRKLSRMFEYFLYRCVEWWFSIVPVFYALNQANGVSSGDVNLLMVNFLFLMH